MVAALGVTVASSALLNYQLAAAPFLAYALIGAGALIKHERSTLRHDMSYGMYIYAFPMQQLLAIAGATALPVWAFAIASIGATFPLAALSWFAVEQPVMRWGKRRT